MDIEQASASAMLGYQLSTRWGLAASAGAILGGSVDTGTKGDVGQGMAVSLSANYLALYESSSRPFISSSFSFGAATSTPIGDDGEKHRFSAFDLRAGVMVGKTFFDLLVPYAAARVFGGPVFWTLGGEDVIGTDTYHYTLGAGLLLQVPGSFSVFIEFLPLGEQSLSAGGSLAF